MATSVTLSTSARLQRGRWANLSTGSLVVILSLGRFVTSSTAVEGSEPTEPLLAADCKLAGAHTQGSRFAAANFSLRLGNMGGGIAPKCHPRLPALDGQAQAASLHIAEHYCQ